MMTQNPAPTGPYDAGCATAAVMLESGPRLPSRISWGAALARAVQALVDRILLLRAAAAVLGARRGTGDLLVLRDASTVA